MRNIVKLDTSVWRRRGHARGRCVCAISTMLISVVVISCGKFDFGRARDGAATDARSGVPFDASIDVEPDACVAGLSANQTSGPVLVQHASAFKIWPDGAPPGTSLSLALPCPTTPGNLLIVTGGNTAGALTTVAGAGVPVWKHAATSDMYNNAELWYVVAPSVPTVESVQISSDGTETDPAVLRMILMEWSGLAVADPDVLEGHGAGSGRTGTMASAAPIMPQSKDLLVFDIAVDNSNFDSPMGWTFIDEATAPGNSTERAWYLIAAGAGPQQPVVMVQNGHPWDAVIAAFKIVP
jgi:hypothetical protein